MSSIQPKIQVYEPPTTSTNIKSKEETVEKNNSQSETKTILSGANKLNHTVSFSSHAKFKDIREEPHNLYKVKQRPTFHPGFTTEKDSLNCLEEKTNTVTFNALEKVTIDNADNKTRSSFSKMACVIKYIKSEDKLHESINKNISDNKNVITYLKNIINSYGNPDIVATASTTAKLTGNAALLALDATSMIDVLNGLNEIGGGIMNHIETKKLTKSIKLCIQTLDLHETNKEGEELKKILTSLLTILKSSKKNANSTIIEGAKNVTFGAATTVTTILQAADVVATPAAAVAGGLGVITSGIEMAVGIKDLVKGVSKTIEHREIKKKIKAEKEDPKANSVKMEPQEVGLSKIKRHEEKKSSVKKRQDGAISSKLIKDFLKNREKESDKKIINSVISTFSGTTGIALGVTGIVLLATGAGTMGITVPLGVATIGLAGGAAVAKAGTKYYTEKNEAEQLANHPETHSAAIALRLLQMFDDNSGKDPQRENVINHVLNLHSKLFTNTMDREDQINTIKNKLITELAALYINERETFDQAYEAAFKRSYK